MSGRRRLPEPRYTPPTDEEREMGYAFTCPGPCGLDWSMRFVDRHLDRCIPCARAWMRDDQMSRRKGLGSVPLTAHPQPHLFDSKVLRREVDLNSKDGHRLLKEDAAFRDEVSKYIGALIAENVKPKTPLRGVLPLLAKPKAEDRKKAGWTDLPVEPVESVSDDLRMAVNKHVDRTMNTVDAEIVDEKPRNS